MGLKDILANPGNPFQSSFLRAEQGRRQQEAFGLQQQLRRQSIQQNDMRLQQQQQQAAMQQQRVDTIRGYQGDKRGLVDVLYRDGDLEGAANLVEFQKRLDSLNSVDREAAKDRMKIIQNDTLDTSGSVLEAFKRDDGGRSGMGLAIQEGERFRQQYGMGDQVPDFRGMHPEEVKQWWENKYNRSSKNREFERNQLAGEGRTKIERLMRKIENGTATQNEIKYVARKTGDRGAAPTQGANEKFKARLNFDVNKQQVIAAKDRRKATTVYRKEAANDKKEYRDMEAAIIKGLKNVEIGGVLGSKNVKITLSQLAGSNVRALAQQQEFENYGTFAQRVLGLVEKIAFGGATDEQLAMAKEIFETMRREVSGPIIKESNQFYRTLAKNGGLNPHEVVPFTSGGEVIDAFESGLLTEKQARQIMEDNRQWIPKKKKKQ